MSRIDVVLRGAGVTVVAGVLATGAYVVGGGGDPALANLWMDTNGGTCVRQSSPAAYADATACDTLDEAQDAASAGDTVRIKNGTYTGTQNITGAKASAVTYIGESKAGVQFTGNTNDLEDFVTLEDMTFHVETHGGGYDQLSADGYDHVTLRNVDLLGDYIAFSLWGATDFLWEGGEFGDFDGSIQQRHCGGSATPDNEPLWVGAGADGIIVDGVHFSSSAPSQDGFGGCSGDNMHLEIWRFDGAATDIIMRRNVIDENEANSAVIFLSEFNGGPPTNLTIAGNIIGEGDNVSLAMTNKPCEEYKIYYNTFMSGQIGNWDCTTDGEVFVGNISGHDSSNAEPTCAHATWIANVIQESSPRNCNTGDDSGNTWVTGTNASISLLGIDSNGRLESGSVGIDAAETPGASDICTDASIMGTLGDIDGDARFQGSKCDAGADERG